MDFAQEANREGQSLAEQPQPVFEGGDIVSDPSGDGRNVISISCMNEK